MSATTATIETLTAEVRVLMIGNRQVTLSIAKQLDWVSLDQIDAFGRVRLSGEENQVIGSHRSSGSLVMARYKSWREHPFYFIDESDLSGKITVCDKISSDRHGAIKLTFKSAKIEVSDKAVERCGKHPKYDPITHKPNDENCPHWYTNGLDQEIAAEIARSDGAWELHVAASKLPLIVLAGLR